MHNSNTSGLGLYFKLLLTAIIWGGTWIAARMAVADIPPLAVATWRYLLATLCLGLLLFVRERRLPRPDVRTALALGLAGLVGIYLYNLFFLFGLQHIGAGRGALVVALNPAMVALTAWLLGSEAMSRRKAAGIALALTGCVLVVSKGSPAALLKGEVGIGELLIVGCVVCWTLYTFAGRRATVSLSPLAMTFYAAAGGGLLLALSAAWQGVLVWPPHYSARGWWSIVYLGVLGTALAFTWYADGVQRLGAARAAAFINLVPLAAVLQAAWLLDERLAWGELFGGALVLLGVALTNWRNSLYPRANSTLAAERQTS